MNVSNLCSAGVVATMLPLPSFPVQEYTQPLHVAKIKAVMTFSLRPSREGAGLYNSAAIRLRPSRQFSLATNDVSRIPSSRAAAKSQ